MIQFNLMQKKKSILVILTFIFIGVLTFINLNIGIKVLRNPTPFQSSPWDNRWAIIFGVVLFLVGFLFFISRDRELAAITILGVGILVILPIITVGAGIAYLVLLLLVLIARGAGEAILHLLLGKGQVNGVERLLLSLLLGFGLIMVLGMVQGFLFAYTPLVTWLGLAVLSALFIVPNLRRWFLELKALAARIRAVWEGDGLPSWALVASLVVILWIPSWLIALAPANRYDELTYHLAAPMLYLQKSGIVRYPEGGTTYWIHYAEMLYTLALQTAGQPLPRMLDLMMGGLSAVGVFLLGKRLVNTRTGIIAALLFCAVPVVNYEAATAYIDLFVTAYTTAVGLALLAWWQDRNPRWLLVAGVLAGLSVGIKLSAGLVIAGLAVLLLVAMVAGRRLLRTIPWIVAMTGLVLVLALPWLVRDFLWTGDPFFPYGSMFLQRMSVTTPASGGSGQSSIFVRTGQFLSYPIDLVVNSTRYYAEAPGGMASALPLLAVPLFIFTPGLKRSTKVIGLGLLAASGVTVALMFFTNSALLRYALPIFPWLAVCAALNVEEIYGWITDQNSSWGGSVLFLMVLVYLFSTRLPLIVRPADNLAQRFPVNYFLGRESREAYLSRTLAVYDAFRFIDSQPGGPHRVLSIGNEFRLYSQARIDGVYDVPGAGAMLSTAQTPAALAQSLAQAGYDFILLNQPEVDFRPWKYSDPYPILKNTDFLNLYGVLAFAQNGMYVYRFEARGANLPPAQNLLQNPGFEDTSGSNHFTGWQSEGAVQASSDAYQGKHSTLVDAPLSPQGAGDVYQKVTVEENQLYTLGYWLKSDQPAVFLEQVRWMDSQGNILRTDENWKNTGPQWQWNYLFSRSPVGARFAEVYASAGGSENVLVDNVCLAKGQRCPTP